MLRFAAARVPTAPYQRALFSRSRCTSACAPFIAAQRPLPMQRLQSSWMKPVQRSMARQSRFSKKTRVATQTAEKPEPEQQSQSMFSSLTGTSASGMADQQQQKTQPSQIDTVDKATAAHMTKVYNTLAQSVGVMTVGSVLTLTTPLGMIHPLIPGLGGLVPLFMLYNSSPHTHSVAYRHGCMGAFTFMSGMSLGPLLSMSMAMNPMNIPLAAGVTTLIFGGCSVAALAAPAGSTLKFGGPLFGCTLGMMFLPVVGMFYPMPILYTVYPYASVALFSAWVAYDTQDIINRFQHGDSDHIQHAMSLFIDLKILFSNVLRIVGVMND